MNKAFSITDSVTFGVTTFFKNFSFFVGAALISFAFLFIVIFASMLVVFLAGALSADAKVVQFLPYLIFISILMIFVGGTILLWYSKISLEFYDKKPVSLRSFFSCFNLLPNFLLALIVYSILFGIGHLFFVIPGIIIASRLMFFPYFIVDKNVGPVESITKSFSVTKGHTLRMVGLFLFTILTYYIIFFYPVGILSCAHAYRNLSK